MLSTTITRIADQQQLVDVADLLVATAFSIARVVMTGGAGPKSALRLAGSTAG